MKCSPETLLMALILSAKFLISNSEPLDCVMVQMDELCVEGNCPELENEGWRCLDDTGVDYELSDLPSGFIQNNKHSLVSVDSVLSVSSATKNKGNRLGEKNEIKIHPGAAISLHARGLGNANGIGNGNGNGNQNGRGNGRMLRHQSRKLASVTLEGDPSFLVVHVTTADGAPTKSMPDIVDDVLGISGDPHNLVSQYTACSGGKLNYKPATGTGITNGGVAITLEQNSTDVNRFTVHGWVDNWISSNHPTWPSDFNHIMYVLPGNVNFTGAAAYAYIGNYKSVYRDNAASKLTVLMHETGHNLRMHHSGEGPPTATYADHTCYMGNPLFNDDTPQMCFNAAKSWHTGWYAEGHQEIDVQVGWEGKLVGVDDFLNAGEFDAAAGERVLLKIPHPTSRSEDLYIMYNRAKGVNAEVVEAKNKVVVVKGAVDPRSGSITSTVQQTWRVVDMDTSTGRYYVYGYGVTELIIQVVEMTQAASGTQDYAMVSITKDTTPTAAPTDCPDTSVLVEITFDNYPEDISWTLEDQSTATIVASGGGYTTAGATETYSGCFESEGPYSFTINDSYGDGLCCQYGAGSYTLYYNYQVVHTAAEIGSGETKVFPEQTAAPSNSPSDSPSKNPTSLPSASPSRVPSNSPSDSASRSPTLSLSPTGAPSSTPTESPSKNPTDGPTQSPSPLPTDSPTREPSSAPTGLPTSSPSRSPTKTPTNPTPAACDLAKLSESCFGGTDCCSGVCSGGNPNRRVCLVGNSPTPQPVESPVTSSPVSSPTPDGGGSCAMSVGDSCTEDVDCCPSSNLLCTGGKKSLRVCYQA